MQTRKYMPEMQIPRSMYRKGAKPKLETNIFTVSESHRFNMAGDCKYTCNK